MYILVSLYGQCVRTCVRFGIAWQAVAICTECHFLYQLLKLLQVGHYLTIMNKIGQWAHKDIHNIHFKHEKQILCTTVPPVVVWAGCPGSPAVCMCDFYPCDPRLCHWFGNTFSWCPSVQDLRTVWHIQMLIITAKDCSGQWVFI